MKLIDWLLELLFPTRCAFCHRLMREPDGKVCPQCRKTLPYVPVESQHQRFAHLDTVLSPLYYEGTVRDSLIRFKFHSLTGYARIYADFLTKCIDESGIFCDSITWVPVSRRRLRHRGYDQARLMAEALSEKLGVPCVRCLEKVRDNPPQSRSGGREARRRNVRDVYRAVDAETVSGQKLLLVDDIVTTGSTLSEAAGVLRKAGAAGVVGITLARSRQG